MSLETRFPSPPRFRSRRSLTAFLLPLPPAQNSKLEITQLLHRLTKVEHVQEELLRILMQPTGGLDGAAGYGHASAEYDSSPNVIKSVLESLYKQVREGSAMRHANAANLVAATQAGLVAGGFGAHDPAQIEAMYGNLARGGAGEAGAGGQAGGYRGPDPGGHYH